MTPRSTWRKLSGASRRQVGVAAARLICRPGRLPGSLETILTQLAAGTPPLRGLGLGELAGDRVLALRRDQHLRWMLQPTADITVAGLLDIGSEHPDLDAAVTHRLREADDQALSAELYRTLVLDRAGPQRRLTLALSTVTLAAGRLTPDNRRAIFTRCLEVAGRPADPYDSSAALIGGSARQAASAILAIDSGFDDEVIEALSDATVRANLQALVASALKERPARCIRALRQIPRRGCALKGGGDPLCRGLRRGPLIAEARRPATSQRRQASIFVANETPSPGQLLVPRGTAPTASRSARPGRSVPTCLRRDRRSRHRPGRRDRGARVACRRARPSRADSPRNGSPGRSRQAQLRHP